MIGRYLTAGSAGLLLGLVQQIGSAAEPAAGTYTPARTPWGEPDLRGTWPINHLISVPLVRPAQFGDRLLMTDEEYEAKQAAIAEVSAMNDLEHGHALAHIVRETKANIIARLQKL